MVAQVTHVAFVDRMAAVADESLSFCVVREPVVSLLVCVSSTSLVATRRLRFVQMVYLFSASGQEVSLFLASGLVVSVFSA